MKLMEIAENGKVFQTMDYTENPYADKESEDDKYDIDNPVTISFTIGGKIYDKLQEAANYYGWGVYNVLYSVCENGDEILSFLESRNQGLC